MRRREFFAFLSGAAMSPLAAKAQQTLTIKRVGILMGLAEGDSEAQARLAAFRKGLEELGWTEGANIELDYHYGAGGVARSRELAAEVIRKKADVIITNSPTALAAAKEATQTIPVVFVQVADPVSDGFVASLAKPGANITGFAISEHTMTGKWLEVLREIAPLTTRVGFIQHTEHPSWPRYNKVIQEAAPSFGIAVFPLGVRSPADVEVGINDFSRQPNGALLVLPDTFNTVNRKIIIGLANQQKMPAIYPSRFYATDGGLISYGGDLVDLLRRAASYVNLALRGANVGDLPVQQATKFELAVNLKTAKALDLTIPAHPLARADEVIE